jgi:acetyl-CoA synthetase
MTVNFTRDVVEASPPRNRALVELRRDGSRREWTFGEIAEAAGKVAARLPRDCAAATS